MSWESFASGFGKSIGGSIGDRFVNQIGDKIFGIPGPSGRELGERAQDYFNAAFPGTSPWERLGSPSPASSMVAANAAQRNVNRQVATQSRLKKDELETSERNVSKQTDTQRYVADQQVEAARIAAGATHYSADTAAGAQRDVGGFNPGAPQDRITADIDFKEAQARGVDAQIRRTDAEIDLFGAQMENLNADTQKKVFEAIIKGDQAELSAEMARAQLSAEQSRGILAFGLNIARDDIGLGEATVSALTGLVNLVGVGAGLFALKWLYNKGKQGVQMNKAAVRQAWSSGRAALKSTYGAHVKQYERILNTMEKHFRKIYGDKATDDAKEFDKKSRSESKPKRGKTSYKQSPGARSRAAGWGMIQRVFDATGAN